MTLFTWFRRLFGPATARPAHPKEFFVLSETQRFARMLGIRVEAVVTTEAFLVEARAPLYPGEKVPAAGRWVSSLNRIEYFRHVVRGETTENLTRLAAHETAHAKLRHKHSDPAAEEQADALAKQLLRNDVRASA